MSAPSTTGASARRHPAASADGPPPIDPRIRGRRVAVQRDEGRRRLRVLVVLVVAAVVVGIGALATRSPLLRVHHLEVVGSRATDPAELRAAARLDGIPMTDVDREATASRLAALAWVASARVERRWPTTVRLVVTERQPAATVEAAGDGWATVDAAGRVLAVGLARPDGLPALTGVSRAAGPGTRLAADATAALAAATALPAGLRPRIADVYGAGSGGVELHLVGGGTVRLGPADELAAKYTAAATVLGRADLKAFKVLDVRVPEAPVLTRS